jgi:hypothetical protein
MMIAEVMDSCLGRLMLLVSVFPFLRRDPKLRGAKSGKPAKAIRKMALVIKAALRPDVGYRLVGFC